MNLQADALVEDVESLAGSIMQEILARNDGNCGNNLRSLLHRALSPIKFARKTTGCTSPSATLHALSTVASSLSANSQMNCPDHNAPEKGGEHQISPGTLTSARAERAPSAAAIKVRYHVYICAPARTNELQV